MIKLKNISKSDGDKQILHKLGLTIDDNQLTCFLGGSGSGKTTILRLIAGLETPQEGEIVINNNTVTIDKEVLLQPHQRELGFIFQDLALWPHYNIYENIAFGLKERKQDSVEEKVLEILDFFDLKEHAYKYPHQLSGGQKQLVAISRSLVLKPKILLMDEPLANLDVKLKRKILEHIKNLRKNFNLTIIYVTHDHKEAFEIADKIVVLNNGVVEESGDAEQLKNSENTFVKYFLEY